MISVDDIVDIEITSFAHGGEGIARYDNFVIFVPYTCIDDKVKVRIIQKKKSFARAELVEILKPSKCRIEVSCPYYFDPSKKNILWCGGCNFLHIDIKYQHSFKKQIVRDALDKIGNIKDMKWDGILSSSKNLYYRNKVQTPVSVDDDSKIITGFFRPKSHKVISVDECLVQSKTSRAINKNIVSLLNKYDVTAFDETINKGQLRNIIVRINRKNEALLVFVTTSEKIKNFEEIIDDLVKKNSNIISIYQNINDKKTNVILGMKLIKKYGRKYITEEVGDLVYKISPNSFFQVNSYQVQNLYETIKEYLKVDKKDIILDLFCGAGGAGLYVSRFVKRVFGVESIESSIKDAKDNADLNNIRNTEYYAVRVEDLDPEKLEDIGINKVIINPPRSGINSKTIDFLSKLRIERIVYSSCNPVTLARDLKELINKGYNVKRVKLVDMFPQTSHIETVVEIVRQN